jgi:glucose/mannose transport system substrate-binding protein
MSRGISKVSLVGWMLALAVATGCGSGDDGSDAPGDAARPTLQLFSWWTAPGEAEALAALVNRYKEVYPGASVEQFTKSSAASWQDVLHESIDDSPWDVFQMSASDLPQFTADHPGAVEPVDSIYAEPSLAAAVIPDVLEAATSEGHAYGVVTGVHRNNAFLYNIELFEENDLTPPTTIAEFLDVAAQLDEAGITPVATSFETWALRILFDELLAGTIGAEQYEALTHGRTPPTEMEAGLQSAIDTFDLVLNQYVDREASSAEGYGWASAVEGLRNNDAAMLFHGDWAKGYLVKYGWEPGVDFGVLGNPGATDLFVYGADTFGLAATGPNVEIGKDFLTVVASKEGQVEFNKRKGSTPMRTDVRDQLDEPGKISLDELEHATVRMPGHANSEWDDGIAAFLNDGDKAALLEVYLTATP